MCKLITDNDCFKKLSDNTQNSLYGRIGCDNILAIVSPHFNLTLRCVRLWAFQRGLYSVSCGYFSGITLAVMVAKVCQEFPDCQPSCLLYKFFDKFAESDWREPVQLNLKKKS